MRQSRLVTEENPSLFFRVCTCFARSRFLPYLYLILIKSRRAPRNCAHFPHISERFRRRGGDVRILPPRPEHGTGILGVFYFFWCCGSFCLAQPATPAPSPLLHRSKMKLWARANVCQGQSQSQYSQYSVHQILRHRIWPYVLSIEIVGYSDTFALSDIATMTVKWPNIVQTAQVLLNNLNSIGHLLEDLLRRNLADELGDDFHGARRHRGRPRDGRGSSLVKEALKGHTPSFVVTS